MKLLLAHYKVINEKYSENNDFTLLKFSISVNYCPSVLFGALSSWHHWISAGKFKLWFQVDPDPL